VKTEEILEQGTDSSVSGSASSIIKYIHYSATTRAIGGECRVNKVSISN
jgi:hypothetical protein